MSKKIDTHTQLFISAAVRPGNFGATIYNGLFKHYSMNSIYLPKKFTDPSSITTVIKLLDISGCSISMPNKKKIIPHLDVIDELAELSMSVNTVINESGKLIGKNTDHYGAMKVLETLRPSSVLIYGAGSVVSSIILALQKLGCPEIALHARRNEAAKKTTAHHNVEALDRDAISTRSFNLLINATPTSENIENDVFSIIDRADNLFDLVVSPHETKLCFLARKKGMKVATGLEMSKWQLQKQFFHYTGVLPEIKLIDKLVKDAYMQM